MKIFPQIFRDGSQNEYFHYKPEKLIKSGIFYNCPKYNYGHLRTNLFLINLLSTFKYNFILHIPLFCLISF